MIAPTVLTTLYLPLLSQTRWHLDPSGTYTRYDAKAIGSGSEGAQSSLQEVYHKGMKLSEAEEKLLIILKQVMEEKLNSTNVEVCVLHSYNIPYSQKYWRAIKFGGLACDCQIRICQYFTLAYYNYIRLVVPLPNRQNFIVSNIFTMTI